MGTKLPATVAATDQLGDSALIEGYLLEKYAWQQDRATANNPTASILRYTYAGGDAAAHIEGTPTQVGGLASLPCMVDDFTNNYARKFGAVAKSGDTLFTFYEVEVQSTDRITYLGNTWEPISIWYRAESGRCDVQARIIANS